jgi:hypothetical protein
MGVGAYCTGEIPDPKRCGGLVDGRAGFEMERLVFVHMTAYGKLLFTADSDFESCRKSDDSRDCETNDGRGCSANGLLDRRRCQGVSRFETLLPHGQPRFTFGEMRLPIPH